MKINHTYAITNDTVVLHRYIGVSDIADNGRRYDEAISLKLAPGLITNSYSGNSDAIMVMWVATNGGPQLVATAESTAGDRYETDARAMCWEFTDECREWLADESMAWLKAALEPYGLNDEV